MEADAILDRGLIIEREDDFLYLEANLEVTTTKVNHSEGQIFTKI